MLNIECFKAVLTNGERETPMPRSIGGGINVKLPSIINRLRGNAHVDLTIQTIGYRVRFEAIIHLIKNPF